MARKNFELELLGLRFNGFTSNIRGRISEAVKKERCEDTSDTVINHLFQTCLDDLASLLAKCGIDDWLSDEQKISVEAREAVRTYIDQALSYEGELGHLEDDEFEALYRSTMEPLIKAKRERRARSARENDLVVLQPAGRHC
jgi:hypothetical protein